MTQNGTLAVHFSIYDEISEKSSFILSIFGENASVIIYHSCKSRENDRVSDQLDIQRVCLEFSRYMYVARLITSH